MHGEELLQYCITHSKTPRPMYSGEQFARMIEIADYPADYPSPEEIREESKNGGYYQLREEMEELIERASNRIESIKGMTVEQILKDIDKHINKDDWYTMQYNQSIIRGDKNSLYYPITDEIKNIRCPHIKLDLSKEEYISLLQGLKNYLIATESYELISRVDNKIEEIKEHVGHRKLQRILS